MSVTTNDPNLKWKEINTKQEWDKAVDDMSLWLPYELRHDYIRLMERAWLKNHPDELETVGDEQP